MRPPPREEADMAFYLDKSAPKLQRPRRQSARLNIASCEPVVPKSQLLPTQAELIRSVDCAAAQKAKTPREAENSSASVSADPFSKRLRASVDTAATKPPNLGTHTEKPVDPVGYWVERSAWPKKYFEPNTLSHRRRKRSEPSSLAASSTTPSDQKPREEKSGPYRDARYEALLETKGIYMETRRTLLDMEQTVPEDSMFQDAFLQDTCEMLRNRNEAKVIQDISRLIDPSAQSLSIRDFNKGTKHLRCLIESVKEGWNNSVAFTSTRPQPDYSVGFKREAFSEEQRKKLAPFIGNFTGGDQSYFMATYYMYFPFLTCEVKCGSATLNIANRQNAHSITLAVRTVVELFRLVKREKEISRKILAFAISHNYTLVRIYSLYAVLSFREQEGKEKWTAYRFTKNVQEAWAPTHFERICSAIDGLPSGVAFDVLPLQQDSGLSQELESQNILASFAGSVVPTEDHMHSSSCALRPLSSGRLFSRNAGLAAAPGSLGAFPGYDACGECRLAAPP
ncbi:hypothetical protein K505DRAFT_352608 [Melanomma pulvis-pyrius CBS 109.77]|uniref:DUF7924 domain-containing protein n=1 Tax=Melanomma pulvis-pyrius CBS 109.77 TaxID=1314802 RepID=A0A6A6WYU5_9PLEO|nr:hypothetical protein K505DRAFT_352608 [Melanomma pulvis-pyrius CBS 109.77]